MAVTGLETSVLIFNKGEERYVFIFQDHEKEIFMNVLTKFADEDGLSFTWYDAVVLAQKLRSM